MPVTARNAPKPLQTTQNASNFGLGAKNMLPSTIRAETPLYRLPSNLFRPVALCSGSLHFAALPS